MIIDGLQPFSKMAAELNERAYADLEAAVGQAELPNASKPQNQQYDLVSADQQLEAWEPASEEIILRSCHCCHTTDHTSTLSDSVSGD